VASPQPWQAIPPPTRCSPQSKRIKLPFAHIAAFDDTEDEDAISKTSDAEADALEAALTCRPTTKEGAIALLEHISTPFEDSTVLAFAFGAGEGSRLHRAAGNLPAMIAETLRSNGL
jgi:hypothetical protein